MEYEGFFVEWIEEWSQFFEACNWYTFRPFMLEFEHEVNMGGVEMTLVIMGLGFRARWNYRETETVKKIKRDVEAIERGDMKTFPLKDEDG